MRGELGARYDHNHAQADSTQLSFTSALDATDHRTSVDGGLSRRFGDWEPYAHVGTGFRSPNLEERYYNDNVHGGMRVFGNPVLRPERSLTSEGGVRGVDLLGGHLAVLRASVYRTEAEDMITIRYFDMLYGVPRFQYQNVRRARLDGAELQADTRLGAVQLNATASFPRGRDLTTGKLLLDVGVAHAVFDLRVPVPRVLPQASLTLRTRWSDATVSDGQQQPSGPAFWTASAELVSVWSGTRVALAHAIRHPQEQVVLVQQLVGRGHPDCFVVAALILQAHSRHDPEGVGQLLHELGNASPAFRAWVFARLAGNL